MLGHAGVIHVARGQETRAVPALEHRIHICPLHHFSRMMTDAL